MKSSRPSPTPKQPKRWDVPASPRKGDRSDKKTFEAVGRALSDWESFEYFFGLIFGEFVGSRNETEPAMRAYGSVLAFSGRLDMVKAAATAYFVRRPPDGVSVIFQRLSDDAKGFSARRNEIAHGMVQQYYPDGQKPKGFVVGPSHHATNKKKLTIQTGYFPYKITSAYAYSSIELEALSRQFQTLAKEAAALHHYLYVEGRGKP